MPISPDSRDEAEQSRRAAHGISPTLPRSRGVWVKKYRKIFTRRELLREIFVFPFIAALLGLIALTATSVHLNQQEIWFSNLDQDSVLLFNALRINDGRAPTYSDHPAQGVYILYGGLFRLFNKIGLSSVEKFSDLEKHRDPIGLVPNIFYSGRRMSILIAILCVLTASASIYVYTGSWKYAGLGSAFLSASPGLLLQSLLIRSELTSVLFLCFAIFLLTLVLKYPNHLSLFFFTGMMFGLAYVTKIQVIPFTAFILFLIASVLSDGNEDQSRLKKTVCFLFTLTALGLLCVLGFVVISSLHLFYLSHVVYRFLDATGVFPGAWISIVILLFPLFGVGVYAYLKNHPFLSKSADVLLGIGLIVCSIFLTASPILLTLVGKLRGRPIDAAFQLPVWQVISLSVALLGLGGYVVWKRGQPEGFLKQVHLSWILITGFLFGILFSLVLCSALGNPIAAGATERRLFSFESMNQFSNSINQSGSSRPVFSSDSIKRLVHEFNDFLLLYSFESYLLSGYVALLIVTFALQGVSPRYLWPSLVVMATGLLFMIFCSVRYYAEQYWVYIDLFFMGAWAFLVFGLIERFNTAQVRIALAVLIGALYFTQYDLVAKAYPHYNSGMRDKIEEAAYAIYEVRDYSRLMKERYGDNLEFIRRVLSDPYLNGSEDGIDLFSKSGIKRVIESTPELKADSKLEGQPKR